MDMEASEAVNLVFITGGFDSHAADSSLQIVLSSTEQPKVRFLPWIVEV